MKTLHFSEWNHLPFSSVLSPFLSRRKAILFPWKVEDIIPKQKGKVALFLVRFDLFFLLDSPVVLTFCLKKCLTTLRVVMSMTYTCLSSERSSGCLFKEVIRPGGIVSKRYIPYPDGEVCLDLTDREKLLGP